MLDVALTYRLEVFVRLLGVVLLLAGPGLAQASPSGSNAAAHAQGRFEAGVVAYEEGRFRDAVELFREADRLAPSARLSFNVAKVYERMGDNRSALAAYREYLRRLPAAENREDVSLRIRELESSLAELGLQQLSVLSVPEGATVLIDEVSRGVTPWTGELAPGPHRLALRLQGYREQKLNVELPVSHAIDVAVQLAAAPAPARSSRVRARSRAKASALPTAATGASVVVPATVSLAAVPSPRTWALFGGGAAACVGSLWLEVSRRHMEDKARSPIQIVHQEKFEAMERRQAAARWLLGAGLLGAVAGGVSLYFDLQQSSAEAPELALGCDSTGCSVQGGARF